MSEEAEHGGLERVRELLIDAPGVGKVLPDAVRLSSARDKALGQALAPTVEEAIATSVRKNPKALAQAIYPVIGPAIRRSIANALAAMTQRFNSALELSLSPKSLGWRIEAWRSQRPFAEVVLLKTLVYRTEQVLLIHRQSGLLLQDAVAASVVAQDTDMVSGMLSAIRDFVTDSFDVAETDSLAQIQYGEFTLRIAQGPHAILAAAVRGSAPVALRVQLQQALEQIHLSHGPELASFDGESSAFDGTRDLLESCLAERRKARTRSSMPILVLVAVALLLGLLAARWVVRESARERAWKSAVENVRKEPGLFVLSDRNGSLRGLRDPSARDPAELMRAAGVDPEQVNLSFVPYTSLEPQFVLARARRSLAPPAGVQLELQGVQLVARGRASGAWIRRARVMAPALSGIELFDTSSLIDQDLELLLRLEVQIEGIELSFEPGTSELRPGTGPAEPLRAALLALESRAARAGVRLRIDVHVGLAPTEEAPGLALGRARVAVAFVESCAAGGLAVRIGATQRKDAKASLEVVRLDAPSR